MKSEQTEIYLGVTKKLIFQKIRFCDPSDDNESDISRRQKHKLSKRMQLGYYLL